MASPATFADVKTRIITETLRDDLQDTLANALTQTIINSVNHYEWERWWFNESIFNATCVVGSIYVPIDPSIIRIDTIRAIIGGVRYKMIERQVDWILAAYSTPVQGQPTEWAILNDQIVIFPQPNQAYPLQMQTLTHVTPVYDGTDDFVSNMWSTVGQDLIVSRAKIMLDRDYLSATATDPRLQLASAAEDEAYTELRSQNNRRMATDRVEPAW